jgi:hypothetical protein
VKFDGSKNCKRCIIGKNNVGVWYPLDPPALVLGDFEQRHREDARTINELEDLYFQETYDEGKQPSVS